MANDSPKQIPWNRFNIFFVCVTSQRAEKEAETKEVEQNNKDGEYISEATTDC